METVLNKALDELTAAQMKEAVVITGHEVMVNVPNASETDATRDKVRNAREVSKRRLELIKVTIRAIDALIKDGYPVRTPQIAAMVSITELRDLLNAVEESLKDFSPDIQAKTTITPEKPVKG